MLSNHGVDSNAREAGACLAERPPSITTLLKA